MILNKLLLEVMSSALAFDLMVFIGSMDPQAGS